MPTYRFQAVDDQGRTVRGDVGAASRDAAAAQVRGRALTPIRIEEGPSRRSARAGGRRNGGVFARNLAMLLQAGHTAEHALVSMTRHGPGKVGLIAGTTLGELRSGASLSEAMKRQSSVFPAHFVAAAEAGESSGRLGQALAELADDEERRAKLVADVRGALAYPAVLGTAMIVALGFMVTVVLPKFGEMFVEMGAPPPPELAVLLGFGAFLSGNWPWLVFAGACAALAVTLAVRADATRLVIDRWWLQAPVLGPIARAALSARFFRVLSLLLRNGQTAAPAFAAARRSVANRWARARFDEAIVRVGEGRSPAAEIGASGVLPPLASDMLRASEDGGVLADGATRLAHLYEDELDRRTRLLVRIAEPVMVGLAGLLIGSMMLSIVSALVGVNEAIAR
ncbi:hypothetical protein GC169_04210 [bacterium]|nr:hypothetical protein [bacterium]